MPACLAMLSRMRRMGLDPGSRRTGIALCEAGMRVACPVTTLEHRTPEEGLRAICEFAKSRQVEEIVVGLPLRLDGSEGEAARRTRRLAAALEGELGLPVQLWDERLTTVAAERSLRDQGVFGRARRRVVDQAAATLLLQSYLDARDAGPEADEYDPADTADPADAPRYDGSWPAFEDPAGLGSPSDAGTEASPSGPNERPRKRGGRRRRRGP